MPRTEPAAPGQLLRPVERALSVCEPWAYLLAAGFKTIENRTWSTAYRGTIAIHASTSDRHLTPEVGIEVGDIHPKIFAALDDPRNQEGGPYLLHRGAIIGTVDIADCVQFDPADDPDEVFAKFDRLKNGPTPEIPHGVWAEGPVCWVVTNARRFRRPIDCKGALNLWRLSPDLQKAVSLASRDLLTDPGEPSEMTRSEKQFLAERMGGKKKSSPAGRAEALTRQALPRPKRKR